MWLDTPVPPKSLHHRITLANGKTVEGGEIPVVREKLPVLGAPFPPGGLAKYREATLQGMSQIKATVLEEQNTAVDGIESYRVVFKANMAGKDLKFCSTAVPKNKKIYLVTGTALEAEYPTLEPQFDQMTYSLKIK